MTITLDGRRVEARTGASVLEAAAEAGVAIPSLCWHPDLPGVPGPSEAVHEGAALRRGDPGGRFGGCGLCVVEIAGRPGPVPACGTRAEEGLEVVTESPALRERRRVALARLLEGHPHACLTCRQKSGCPREPCSMNVPREERCCGKLGRCAIERLHDRLGFSSPLPPFVRDGRLEQRSALFAYDWNLCVGCLRCVAACAGLRRVGALGYVVEEGRPRPGFLSGTPEESGCRFCGACAEVCPTGAILDRDSPGAEREKRLVPCRAACPAGLDVPRYVRALAEDRPGDAARTVRRATPFGRVLGRVCHAPCQTACRRAALTEPVSVCALKRTACDSSPPDPPRRAAPTGRRVAVVGGGPAGLAAASFLAQKGHAVTVFEERPEAGGMPRWAIPASRLPAEVVAAEVAEVAALGVEVRTGARVADVAALRREHDALLVATGLPLGKRLPVPGAERAWNGLDFLRAARSDRPPSLRGRVLVIGGGNVAVDCALVARERGAAAVTAVCLESEREMPAFPREVARAREVGVRIRNSWGPARIEPRDGALACVFVRCVSVFDAAGRFAPTLDDSVRTEEVAEDVIAAIGQQADDALRPRADPTAGVLVAGDAGGGPFSVVHAIASGLAAASRLDVHLGGDGTAPDGAPGDGAERAGAALGSFPGFASLRAVAPAAGEDGGFSREEAVREASRCLQCDLRLALRAATPEGAAGVPEAEGVLRLYGADHALLHVAGTPNLRAELARVLPDATVRFFAYDLDPYYTKRESELLQAYVQANGRMPPGLSDLEDLY